MITNEEKKLYIDWFLDNNILENKESVEVLKRIYFDKNILERVNFVNDLFNSYDYENIIYIPSNDTCVFGFYLETFYFDDIVFENDVSKVLGLIEEIDGEFHVCLDYSTDDKGFFDYLFVNEFDDEFDDDMFDYQKDEELYVKFLGENYKNKTNNSNSYNKNLELYKSVKRNDLDLFVEKTEIDGRILILKNKIDDALDNRDKELFLKLTDELLNLQKAILK